MQGNATMKTSHLERGPTTFWYCHTFESAIPKYEKLGHNWRLA
jgi:hypothetical protein